MHKIKRILYTALFYCIFLLSTINCQLSTAYASIEVDPIRLELETDAEKTLSGYLTLTNHSEEPTELSFSPGEYRYLFSDNTVYPQQSKLQKLPSCRQWISFKPDKIKLQKGTPQQIQYLIAIPPTITGEYVAAILIDEERKAADFEQNKTGQVKIKITPRISIPVYVTTKKSLRRSCTISELTALQSSDKKSVEISVILKNTGTTHLRPLTTFVILNENGVLENKASLGKSLPIFADFGERLFTNWIPNGPGKYTLAATVDIGAGQLIQKSVVFTVTE